jgi:hypothetical protein
MPAITLTLPYNQWLTSTERSCSVEMCSNAPRSEDGKAASVRATNVQGHLVTTSAIYWGGLGRSLTISWKLMPLSLWVGAATRLLHDEDAIKSGERERGDLIGGIVSVNGTEFVLAERVTVQTSLPEAASVLPFAQAKDYFEASNLETAGRSDAFLRWESIGNMPVVVERDRFNEDVEHGTVYVWNGKQVEAMFVHDLVELRSLVQASPMTPLPSVARRGEQMALF